MAAHASPDFDVVVVGAGNAALCAALSAREGGARVLVLERAPENARGGNSFFTGGLMRFPYHGIDDIRGLIPDLTDEESKTVDVGQYSEDEYFEDIARVTQYRADADLTSIMADEAYNTIKWMQGKGVRFALAYGRQAFQVDGKFRFWGDAPVEIVGGGPGLVDGLFDAARREGIEIWYGARATSLLTDDDGGVRGVDITRDGNRQTVSAGAVVLASGGFEANSKMRAQYLGPNWDLAKVRGTEYNTGDGIRMALDIGAQPYGHWSGCHAVAWDLNSPDEGGDRQVGESYQKHSYPFGIVVNQLGQRFLDEGADFRNYTYAKYGKAILEQPGMVAYQIFDSKVKHLLRDEYRIAQVTKVEADTIEELADGMEIGRERLVQTISDFNAAAAEAPQTFNPTIKDGRAAAGINPPKSNWALPIDTPPFEAYVVTCGITFTFGGLRINSDAQVMDEDNRPIAGLYAAGELVGGLFYYNYPGGAGLTSGSVFGRIAGKSAAQSTASGV